MARYVLSDKAVSFYLTGFPLISSVPATPFPNSSPTSSCHHPHSRFTHFSVVSYHFYRTLYVLSFAVTAAVAIDLCAS
jgi:hypothetical protein